MGARYLLTGVQLGMLVAIPDAKERQKIVDGIADVQFIEGSDQSIVADIEKYREQLQVLELLDDADVFPKEDIIQMRERHKKDIEALRESCKHEKLTDWIEEQWAPGHSTGRKVKVCKYCEKVMDESRRNNGNEGEDFLLPLPV